MNIDRFTAVKRFVLLFVAVCAFVAGNAQQPAGSQVKVGPKTKINLKHADRLIGNKDKGYQRLIGAVQFEHEGHVFIQQGDSLRMWSDFLTYDGNTRIAVASKNVRLTEADMTLTTDAITYDLGNKFASYTTGGRIVNKDNVLTSKNGYYSSESKTLTFKHNVVLTNPQYVMNTADS